MPSPRLHAPRDHQPEDRSAVCGTPDHSKMCKEASVPLGNPANIEDPPCDLSSASGTSHKPPKVLYRRPRLDHPGPMEPENNVEPTRDHYMVEKLLGKRTSQGRTQYLVRWLCYSPEHNVWYVITNLDLAKDLVNKYNWDHEAGTFTQPKESC